MVSNKNFEILSKYLDVNKDGLSQRSNNDKTPIILTDEIVMIQTNDVPHYTFKLLAEQEGDEFYNLNIFANSQGEIIDFKVFRYTPDDSWIQGASQTFSGYVSVANNVFELGEIQDTLYSRTIANCVGSVSEVWECSFGNAHAPGTCDSTSFEKIITVHLVPCPSGGGDGSNGGGL